MKAPWQCGVCETVNHGGTTCSACGASLTLRSRVATSIQDRLTPPVPEPPPPSPLPDPVKRAINREPVPDEELAAYEPEMGYSVTPIPGGCLVAMGPRRRW